MREAVTPIPGVNVINDRLMYHQTPVSVWVDVSLSWVCRCTDQDSQKWSVSSHKKDEYHISTNIWHWWCFSFRFKWRLLLIMAILIIIYIYDIGLFTNNLKLIDLENMYPFADNESVAYIPHIFQYYLKMEPIPMGVF